MLHFRAAGRAQRGGAGAHRFGFVVFPDRKSLRRGLRVGRGGAHGDVELRGRRIGKVELMRRRET